MPPLLLALLLAAPADDAGRLLDAGLAALDAGDPAAAAKHYADADAVAAGRDKLAARYGRAVALLRMPNPNFGEVADVVAPATHDGAFADRGGALEIAALCHRQRGVAEADAAKAAGHFRDAARFYREAREWYRAKKRPADAALNQCRAAEMELRLGHFQDARRQAEEVTKSDESKGTPARPLALYVAGFAALLERDTAAAGAFLQQLAPFDQVGFGAHARYLAGRALHRQGEVVDAQTYYQESANEPGAAYQLAALLAERGRDAEALAAFRAVAANPSPFAAHAGVRAAFLLTQLGKADEALALLQPLPPSADALWATGRAERALNRNAVETLKRAADLAKTPNDADKDAKARRAEIAFDLADARLAAGQFKEAAQAFEQLLGEQNPPGRKEETFARLIAAVAGTPQADQAQWRADEFRKLFPQGANLPGVLYRAADAAQAKALTARKQGQGSEAQRAAFLDAAGRFRELAEAHPAQPIAARAKLAAAICLTPLGRWEEAASLASAVPEAERRGDLAPADLLLAEALRRRGDPGAAGRYAAFVAASPKAPETPAALLHLGRSEPAALARLRADFPDSPAAALAPAVGAPDDALRRLANEGTGAVAVAAALELAGRPNADAATLLEGARRRADGLLAGDPERAHWLALLAYRHGQALAAAGKRSDARKALEPASSGPPSVAAEAALLVCRLKCDDLRAEQAQAQKEADDPAETVDRRRKAREKLDRLRNEAYRAADQFSQKSEPFRKLATAEARSRFLYEGAWAWRWVATFELARMRAEAAENEPGTPPERLRLGAAPSEERSVQALKRLLDEAPDGASACEARLELAELAESRGDLAGAANLLREALERAPSDRPADAGAVARGRRRLASLLAAKGEWPAASAALAPVDPVAAGECLLAAGDDAGAATLFEASDAARAKLRLGQALLGLARPDEARAAFEAVPPGEWSRAAKLGGASARFAAGRAADALPLVEELAAGSDDVAARALLLLGGARLAAERPSEAAALFLQAAAFAPGPGLASAARLEAARALAADARPAEARRLLDTLGGAWADAAARRRAALR